MKKLSCADLGGSDCRFTAEGNTDEEIINKLFKHAEEAHPEIDSMPNEKKEEITNKMKELLQKQ